MDDTTYRSLDAVARSLGQPLSVREVVEAVRRRGAPAYYANSYNALRAAESRGTLRTAKVGRSLAFMLDLAGPGTVDELAEVEILRKRAALAGARDAPAFTADLERTLRWLPVDFACAGDLLRGLRLRRVALLAATRGSAGEDVRRPVLATARKAGFALDLLVLPSDRIPQMLSGAEGHPVPELLRDATAFHLPQGYWGRLADAASGGTRLAFQSPTDPAAVPRAELTYNLARHGAPLLGAGSGGRDLCAEYTIASALAHKEARIRGAGALLLSQGGYDPAVLAFVASRGGVEKALRRAVRAHGTSKNAKALVSLFGVNGTKGGS